MDTLAFINASFLWFFSAVMLYQVILTWGKPEKKIIQYSELFYVLEFFIVGFYVLFLFKGMNITEETHNRLYGYMLLAFIISNLWVHLFNMLPTYLKVKRNPSLVDNDPVLTRNYTVFLKELDEKYKKDNSKDILKDLSRKALHFILLALVIGIHEMSFRMEATVTEWGLTPLAFRNFLYVLAAMFFVFMFTTGDLYRQYAFQYIPQWGRKWYGKSLEARTEAHTLISSVPFLLTLMLFVKAQVHVLFAAAIVSAVADAMASMVGKSFGKHKMIHFGVYPEKSYEGLIAGALSAFIGIIVLFHYYPVTGAFPGISIVIAFVCALVFIYTDAYSRYLCDNITNSLFPGLATWLILYFFAA